MGRAFTLLLCLLAAGGCASTTYAHQGGDSRIQGAFEQPFRDMSMMRENPPNVLIHAAAAPYDLPGDGGCEAIVNEIAALDVVLGPDLDAPNLPPAQSNTDVSALVSGAIGGVIGLPFRAMVRRLSGAEGRAQAVREAIFAGMVRRAFLKGVARADNCAASSPPTSPPPDAGDAASLQRIPSQDPPERPPSAPPPSSVQQPGASGEDRQTALAPDTAPH